MKIRITLKPSRDAIRTIGDFTYGVGENNPFLMSYDKRNKYQEPKTFYKYYALSENSVDAVTTPYLYASHPGQLNDPFDCYKEFILFDDEESANSVWKKEEADYLKEQVNDDEWSDYSSWGFYICNFFDFGIFSMTTNPNNELMWAHYAKREGFCVELDINQFLFLRYGPFPINYQDEVDSVRLSEADTCIAVLMQCSIKRKIWSYENEWRLLVSIPKQKRTIEQLASEVNDVKKQNRKINYPVKAIKRIIFRQDFFERGNLSSKKEKDGTMEYEYTTENEHKIKLLDFIRENDIPISIQTTVLFGKYEIRSVQIEKMDDTYSVTENESKNN